MIRRRRHIQRPEYGALFFFDEKRFEASIRDSAEKDIGDIFAAALTAGDEHLNNRFLQGEDIHKLVRDRSEFIDRLIYYAWMQFDWDDGITLIAVGGYGRGEMHPHSDIDLLFLLRKDNPKRYRDNIAQFLTFLWDLQLKIGHSVRTIKQCASSAKEDVTIMTNLLEFRTLVGPIDLGTKLGKKVSHLWSTEKFFHAKIDEQNARHAKHGITEFDLEPNVKESPGGLRDIQTINWLAKRTYQVSGLEKLARRKFYNDQEYHSLKAAEGFLWKVRFGLHMLANRADDHLQFEHQRRLADMFGYVDTDERLAVEQFMQRYYKTVSLVREINDVLTQLLEDKLSKSESLKVQPINERFNLRGRYLELSTGTTFKEDPSTLIEVFVILAQDKSIVGIDANTIRAIREYCYLIDEDFRENQKNKKLFVELLKSAENLSVPLQKMSRYGVLGRYLPEFGKIMGLTQHDLFHIYPVDIHTLAVIRNIREFRLPESRKTFPVSSYTYASYPKPEVLIVAGLYHDIGKGRGGDHSEIGGREVEIFAKAHGFKPTEVRLMVWLVENHLFMSRFAQREDISDPDVVARFAKHVGDETRLNLLHTLTTADILATNPTLWNSWRASLMRQLYHATRNLLRNGVDQVVDRQELITESRDAARIQLNAAGFSDTKIDTYWSDLDENYFVKETIEDIVWHSALLIEHDGSNDPTIEVKPYVNYQRERATIMFVRGPRSPYLFYSVVAAIGNSGLNIQDVRLYASQQSNFLTIYLLNESAQPLNDQTSQLNRLVETLHSELDVNEPLASKGTRTPRRLKQLPVPTSTSFRVNGSSCILEVVTADRSGLLATIAEVLLEHEIHILSAKITTLGERVEDLFVIEHINGDPITDQTLIESMQDEICTTIDQRVEAIATS